MQHLNLGFDSRLKNKTAMSDIFEQLRQFEFGLYIR